MDGTVVGFEAAARTFRGLLAEEQLDERWTAPSCLDGYSVGGLVGHVLAATAWTIPLLDTGPAPDARPLSLGRYYAGMRIEPDAETRGPMHEALLALGAKSAEKGAEHHRRTFDTCVSTIQERLAVEDLDRLIDLGPAIPHRIRLRDFLATRVVELVVHGDDLSVSLGSEPPAPDPQAAEVTTATLLATARAVHGDVAVVRALARRDRAGAEVFPVF